MEQKERMLLEITVAVVFVALLILGSVVVINASEGSRTETTITDSFNTYNYNIYPYTQRQYATSTPKPYFIDYGNDIKVYRDYDGVVYLKNDAEYSDNKRYLRYDYDSRLVFSEGLFGNDVNRYEVYVRNRDYVGGNFKVVFYFEYHHGNVDSHAITHYIPAREEKLFLIKDISPSTYKYKRWWYTIDSLDKTKDGVYYYRR